MHRNDPGAHERSAQHRCAAGHLPAADNDVCQVAQDYELPVDAVRAAVAYYERNREAIDARLAQNATTIA